MCLSPLKIANKSTYYRPDVSALPSFYEVPCGKCDECRNFYMSEWRTRISYEIDSLYKRGGKAIFLTFTYNDSCLPHLTSNGITIPCFSGNDVKRFLNKIKVYANRTYGKYSYKYFFTSEYGKNTKRPHYHALFFLEQRVDEVAFAEKCRQYWNYGFMFPQRKGGVYVGNDGSPAPILIRSLAGGAKYVSKYVTKDLSYFDDAVVSAALAPYFVKCEDYYTVNDSTIVEYSTYYKRVNPKDIFKDCMPKHFQSKGFGSCILSRITDSDYPALLEKGIFNPLTLQYDPLPSYVINKLMYKNVVSSRLNSEGKPLYDRFLTDFGKQYLYKVFDTKRKRILDNYRSFVSSYIQYSDILKNVGLTLFDVDSVINDVKSLEDFATWYVAYRFAPDCVIDTNVRLSSGIIDDAFSYSRGLRYFTLSRDLVQLRKFPPQKYKILNYDTPAFRRICAFRSLVSLYQLCTCTLKSDNYFYNKFVEDGINKLKRYYNIYDNKFC